MNVINFYIFIIQLDSFQFFTDRSVELRPLYYFVFLLQYFLHYYFIRSFGYPIY